MLPQLDPITTKPVKPTSVLLNRANNHRNRRRSLRNLLRFPLDDPGQAAALYFSLVRRVGRVAVPKRL